MADNVMLWPSIQARIDKELNEGYLVTAIRMSEHTRGRLGAELRSPAYLGGHDATFITSKSHIGFIETPTGRILVKLDANMPDDAVILQTDVIPRKYTGPVRVDVDRPDTIYRGEPLGRAQAG